MSKGPAGIDSPGLSPEVERIKVRGKRLVADLADVLLAAPLSMSTDSVVELGLTFADPDGELWAKGLFALDTAVDYADLRFRIIRHELTPADGGTVEVACHEQLVVNLRRRRGVKVMRNASATDFVRVEAKAAGATKVIAQPTSKRPQVARDTRKADVDEPSSWSTFDRLAGEEGFIVFAVAGVVYFGAPTWLMGRDAGQPGAPGILVDWRDGKRAEEWARPEERPACAASLNADDKTTISAVLPLHRLDECRPGRRVKLRGVPGFNGGYLLDGVDDVDLTDPNAVVTINASTPEDPEPEGVEAAGAPTGRGEHADLVDAAVAEGFRGDALVEAIAYALAESDGNPMAKGGPNRNGTFDYGAWQINSVHTADGFDIERAYDLRYNAKWAFKLSKGGRDWSPWYAKPTKEDYRAARAAINPPEPATGPGGGAPGRTSSRSLLDFVTVALSQAGDAYIFGAEASASDPDPDAFDCSELVEWASARVGVTFVDGSMNQYGACQRAGTTMSVAAAIRTRGALLFRTTGYPTHVAISLGDGNTIEAMGRAYGVRRGTAAGRFNAAGIIPGMVGR